VTYYADAATGGMGPIEYQWSNYVYGTSATFRFWRGWYDSIVSVTARDTGIPFPAHGANLYIRVIDCDTPDPNGQIVCPY
jgi:hypothetical protein